MSISSRELLLAFLAGLTTTYALYTYNTRPRTRPRHSLLDLVGDTPLVLIPSLSEISSCAVYAKCEYLNPCGSSKDRVAKQILIEAQADIKEWVVEASSGSTGISMTRMCNALGFKTMVVVPDDQAKEKIQLIRVLGANVELVRPASIVNPEHNVNVARTRAKEMGGFFADQFENAANVRAHLQTGREIWEQTGGRVDAFVAGAGTGGTLAGVGMFLKAKIENVEIVLADPPGSALFHAVKDGVLYAPEQSERTLKRHRFDTITEGIGLDRMTENAKLAIETATDAEKVSDLETVRMARHLLLKDGFFVGSSSALNCVAALRTALKLGPGHVIVTVFCSSGEREMTKIHSKEFCESRGLTGSWWETGEL